MLSHQQNEYLTRVGPGTPMGELFRRFWLPALLSEELGEPDGPPVRTRLLGEDLVAFRDSSGRVGIVDAYCAHRGAPLFWGRNEECGLRCVYHGWKYDVSGACLDIPTDPVDSRYKDRVRIKAYPAVERAGVVWTYLGPPEDRPEDLPELGWVTAPTGCQHVTKWLQRSNWVQGMEGEIDPAHLSFLHSRLSPEELGAEGFDPLRAKLLRDGRPRVEIRREPYGLSVGARRSVGDGRYYWRVTRWLLPTYSVVQDPAGDRGGRCWVPIDDEHTWTFAYQVKDTPYTRAESDAVAAPGAFPPRLTRGTFTLADGYVIDASLPVASKENDYLIDRDKQRKVNYTGMVTGNDEDRALQETMGRIVDRGRERLTASDSAISAARHRLLSAARELAGGTAPRIAHDSHEYDVRSLDLISTQETLEGLLESAESVESVESVEETRSGAGGSAVR